MVADKTLSFYNTNAPDLAKRYESADLSSLHARLSELMPAQGKILEIGCGTGRDAAQLLKSGFDIECVDGSNDMIAAAKKLHPELNGRINQLIIPEGLAGIPSEKYAAIYALAVLMHLYRNSATAALEHIQRILLPKGVLFFSVPLKRPDMERSGYDAEGRYFLLQNREQWISMIEKNGFIKVSSEIMADSLGRTAVTWLNVYSEKAE
jgi:SAM-dependent methyltransferase